jgi:biopolymer transport protein ExbB
MNSAIAQTLSTQLTTATNTVTAAVSSAQNAAAQAANPYGLGAIWSQGDWVAKLCLLLLIVLSVASWAVMVRKYLELKKTAAHAAQGHAAFTHISEVGKNLQSLDKDSPLRFIVDSSEDAVRQYAALKPRVDYDTWLIRAIENSLSGVQLRMQEGLALLATIGSTAPFVGLFGTVWAIYSALVKIGASGQASIDRVAGPVGEALIMTAIGLAVAVPAVFGYNWLLRKNKLALESMRSFGSKLHVVLLATEKPLESTTEKTAPEDAVKTTPASLEA